MKARANGRWFESPSWNGVVSLVVAASNRKTTLDERVKAAQALEDGVSTVVAGVLIKPEGARE